MRAAASVLLAFAACSTPPAADYWPDRRDYIAFREAQPDILEPNYLPFMLHRLAGDGPEGDLLILCRWDDRQMPIDVLVDRPRIPESMQDEVHPVEPDAFAARVEHALRIWERELEGLVTFRLVDEGEAPELRIRLLGVRAPTPQPHIVVLGATEALLAACTPRGWDPDANRLEVRFQVPELILYVADEYGLLTPGQVERVALHEIGHALGMLGHSPMPGDMMFAAYRDWNEVETLSEADVNSFLSLYRLPNGTHYGHVSPGRVAARTPPWPPTGGPELQAAPQVDVTRGFSLQLPAGWLWADADRGLFAANGPAWDYDASLELAVWPYGDVESFLARYGRSLFANTWFRRREPTALARRAGLRVLVEDESGSQLRDFRFVPLGDGRLLMVVAQSPLEAEQAWSAWFEASLATLELSTDDQGWR